jgi:hypothetical protein
VTKALLQLVTISTKADGSSLTPDAKEIYDELYAIRDDWTKGELYFLEEVSHGLWLARFYRAISRVRFEVLGASAMEGVSSTDSIMESPLQKAARTIIKEITPIAERLGVFGVMAGDVNLSGNALGDADPVLSVTRKEFSTVPVENADEEITDATVVEPKALEEYNERTRQGNAEWAEKLSNGS